MAIWTTWKPTTGRQPREGDCGSCVHIKRDASRLRSQSAFACGLRFDSVRSDVQAYPYRVKALKPPPNWCPIGEVPLIEEKIDS